MQAASVASRAAHAEVLSIGDELLHGEIVDTNAAYLAQQLLALGFSVRHFQTAGDDSDEIIAAFRLALDRSDLVLATGGLGPTADDLTVAALARALGVPLVFHPEVMTQMAHRLRRPERQLPAANRKQAYLPEGAHVLRNDWGTAPGCRYSSPRGDDRMQHVFLMPGVPSEMKGLFGAWIAPFLKEHVPARDAVAVKFYHSMGLPESILGERLKDLMQPGRNPDVGTRVSGGVVSVRVVARAATPEAAEALAAPLHTRIRRAMAGRFFGEGDTTPASAAAEALLSTKQTVAIAESCTAGLVAATLARVPGVSAALMQGVVTYSNASKIRLCGVEAATLHKEGAVSVAVARQLAEGVRERAKTNIGVSVTGIAGPAGATHAKPVGLVYIGVATPQVTRVVELNLPGLERNIFRERVSNLALYYLRCTALRRDWDGTVYGACTHVVRKPGDTKRERRRKR